MNKKLFWFDTETTGINPQKQDIIQLAYIIDINGEIKEEGNFYCQPFNYDTIEKAALEVNKTTIKDLKTYQTPQLVYKKLVKVLEKYVDRYNKKDKFSLAGYNVKFDTDFLKQFFFKNNDRYYGSWIDYHILDVMSLAYIIEYVEGIKLDSFKLVNLAKYFGIEFEAHDALNDIRITRELFYKLIKNLEYKNAEKERRK